MKKNIFIAAASFLLFVSASAFAKTNSSSTAFVTPKIQDGLKEEFGQVQNVDWAKRPDNQIVATFTLNNQEVNAYFTTDGDYQFSTTHIEKENLPLKVSLALNKNFADKNVRAVLQMCNAEGTSYYFFASDAKGKSKVWKAYTDGQIELFKSI